jgi:heptosyltransferase-2
MGFNDPPASLLVRATNWLGDAVMTTPALAAVREGFPDARIVLLARPLVAELFRHHPDVDEVMIYERPGRHEGAFGRLRLAGEVRRRRFDGALLLKTRSTRHGSPFSAGSRNGRGIPPMGGGSSLLFPFR